MGLIQDYIPLGYWSPNKSTGFRSLAVPLLGHPASIWRPQVHGSRSGAHRIGLAEHTMWRTGIEPQATGHGPWSAPQVDTMRLHWTGFQA